MNISLLLDRAADGLGNRVLVGRRAAGLTAVTFEDFLRQAGQDGPGGEPGEEWGQRIQIWTEIPRTETGKVVRR